MLRKLTVKNFAIISDLQLSPGPGLTVFTGETGAGKSIVIEALSFVLGARGDSSLIKDGQTKMTVTAEFDAEMLAGGLAEEYGIHTERFTLKRELDGNGKSKAYIDNRPITVAALSKIGNGLVDFHGQHEHQSLMNNAVQLHLLDQYAKLEPLVSKTAKAYAQVQQTKALLKAAQMSEQEKQRMLDMCQYQLQEIEGVNPKAEEDLQLEQALPKMKNAGKLLELCQKAYEELYEGETSAVELAGKAARGLQDMAKYDETLSEPAENLQTALALLEDVSSTIGSYKENISLDPQTLDQMLSRHEKIKRLKAKYGPEIANVLQTADQLKTQINSLENSQQHEQELQEQLEKENKILLKLCEDLHDRRTAAAEKLAHLMVQEITPLGFKEVRFKVAVEMDPENPGPSGADQVEFLFAPNPGQALRPLKNIASGGEISRVMLGLKTVLANMVPVMVFDEVDAGIGGETAVLVGKKLKQVAQNRQVLSVTHLATVAAQAQGHFHVAKQFGKNTTDVIIEPLTGEKLTVEIARMLGSTGGKDTAGFKHAQELLKTAGGK